MNLEQLKKENREKAQMTISYNLAKCTSLEESDMHFMQDGIAKTADQITTTSYQAGVRDAMDVVEDYEKRMRKISNKMMGTAHEDSKIMLAYDMHSRLIATEHIKEALLALIKE